jgi:DNA-binding LacI/PurR family transcriptional regulator
LPSEESGRRAALDLLARDVAFDSIFATSDLAALGAIRALRDARLDVPGDVSIVGFDDLAAARLSDPPLTTISQDARQAGEALVATLIAKIEDRAPDSVLLPVRLVVRQTT